MAPIYLGKMVVPSSLRYIENLAEESILYPEYQVTNCLTCHVLLHNIWLLNTTML